MKAGRDEHNQELDEVETNKVRTALEDFLTCLGTYCPENFMFTVINDATSYEWVLRRIHETFQLDNRGSISWQALKLKLNLTKNLRHISKDSKPSTNFIHHPS